MKNIEYPVYAYPKKVLICTLSDGTKLYETVHSNEEHERLYDEIEAGKECVRRYFKQYPP